MRKKYVSPIFDFNDANTDTNITNEPVVIIDNFNNTIYNGRVNIWLKLLPKPRIITHLPDGFYDIVNFDKTYTMNFKEEYNTVRWPINYEPVVSKGSDQTYIDRVIFHLFNFKRMYGSSYSKIDCDSRQQFIGKSTLSGESWNICIYSYAKSSGNYSILEDVGGYGITHIGEIRKLRGVGFYGREIADLLNCLRLFFSFCLGAWCNPVCPVGLNRAGDRVWEMWSSPKAPWSTPLSWFDPRFPDEMVELFPGFYRRWLDKDRSKSLRDAVYWYLNSNSDNIGKDAGIIITQAAIELLAYDYLVSENQIFTAEKFKHKPALSYKRFFQEIGIPTYFSCHTPGLKTLASQQGWNSGSLRALTEVRNELTHAVPKLHGKINQVVFEAWNLGLWYLEMAILRLCDYTGTFRNRLDISNWGELFPQKVPWTTSPEP